ncbi:MAG: ferritin-like domain-containing protein [Gemmatimonadota bacterium]
MEMESLKDLYLDELKDVLNAEKQLLKALPKMARAATHDELRSAFEDHLNVTEEQVRRLETIFDDLGKPARGKKCLGMEGLIAEGNEMMEEDMEPEVLDAALISAAQRVEHYEIAAYGTLRTYARQLGFENHAELLQQTLDEEGDADKLLTQIAESRVNVDAEVGEYED